MTANNATRLYGRGAIQPLIGSITRTPERGQYHGHLTHCTASASSSVGTYSIVPSLSDPANRLGNYSLTVNNGTLTIIQAAPVGLTGIAPNAGPTNGGTAVSIAGTNFLTGATVNFGSLPAASVTVNSLTNIIAITPAQGVGEVNVVLTNADGQRTVLTNGFVYQAEPTITWAAPAAMTYGAALSAQQLNASAGVPGVFAYSPTAGTVLNAGTTTLTVVFTPQDTVDYSIASNNVSLEVVPAPLAVTAHNVSRQYGQSNPALTGSITGLQNGDNITATYSCTATASSSVGTYSIVPTLVDPNNRLGNYSVTLNDGSLTVTTVPLGVTANSATRQYGQNNPTLTGSITGLQNGDNITATYSCTATASSTVGTYSIVPSLSDPANRLGNYSVTLNDGTLTVTTAPLSVTANNATRLYGQSNPTLTGSITGLQNGDNITATYSCTATASSSVGTYSIVPTLVDPNNRLGNYSVTLNDGSLTVTTAPLAVTANNATRLYGRSNPALIGSITGLQNGDNITATYSCTATASSTVGTYSIVPSLSDPANRLGNYSLTVNNGTLTIIQAAPVGLTGIAPNAGPTNGGTAVSIAGTTFLTGATVNCGSLPAGSVNVNSLTYIIARTPAQGVGEVNVVLTNGGWPGCRLDQRIYLSSGADDHLGGSSRHDLWSCLERPTVKCQRRCARRFCLQPHSRHGAQRRDNYLDGCFHTARHRRVLHRHQ